MCEFPWQRGQTEHHILLSDIHSSWELTGTGTKSCLPQVLGEVWHTQATEHGEQIGHNDSSALACYHAPNPSRWAILCHQANAAVYKQVPIQKTPRQTNHCLGALRSDRFLSMVELAVCICLSKLLEQRFWDLNRSPTGKSV